MSAARRDQLWMAAAAALWLVGLVGWWRLPLTGRSAERSAEQIDLPLLALWLSAAGIVAGLVWLMGHRAGEGWSPLVASLTLAATAPLSIVPVVMPGNVGSASRVALALAASAVAPLAWRLADRIDQHRGRRLVRAASMLCVGLGIVAIALVPATRAGSYLEFPYLHPLTPWGIRWLLVGAATIIPGLVAAAGAMRAPLDRSGSDRAIVSAAVLAGAGILPVGTGAALWHFSWPSLIVPMAAALAMVAILGLIAIGPLARSAGVFAMQRDLLAVGSDHERLRLAAALHDGPLSDVSVLVQRLDAAGDHENAALARAIADQLREVGNDLRLPIVEDLGVAAALEWLVGRTTSTTTPIALEVDEATRPPAEVEAAVYRVAQEALLNATRHGAPPVLVRYEAHIGQVTLLVRDAGTGIAAGAAERAQREGRLGLLMMHQRADAIGAQLAVELDPAGGTAVRLTWAPPSA